MRRAALRAVSAGCDASRWVGAAVATVVACAAPGDPVARAIEATIARELGVTVRSVRCQRATCTIDLADGTQVPVRVDGADQVAWETPDLLDPRPIAQRIAAELDDLGAAQAVDCGGLRPAPSIPVTIECRLGGGGAAWATVDGAGAIDLELALTAAIADARRTGPGDDALDQRSRALDTDEAEGPSADPTTDDAAAPAGAGPAGAGGQAPAPRSLGG